MVRSSTEQNVVVCINEQYALDRVASICPGGDLRDCAPSLRQCVGTRRLWGAELGRALFEQLRGAAPLQVLVDIAIICRTILVLVDHLDDESIKCPGDRLWIETWIVRLETELAQCYESVNEDFDGYLALRKRSADEVSRRDKSDVHVDPFTSSIEKCLIFFNPFRLKVAGHTSRHGQRIFFLEIFFFACQLLDDFFDLSEDICRERNHNVFCIGRDTVEALAFSERRQYWVIPLLSVIRYNLLRPDVVAGISGCAVFARYHRNAVDFLESMFDMFELPVPHRDFAGHRWARFETWGFCPCKAMLAEPFPAEAMSFVRPEFLQVFSDGARDILEV